MATAIADISALWNDANLVNYWKCDDTSGTTVTASKGGINGTASRTNILNNPAPFGGCGLAFVAASSDNVDCGAPLQLDTYTNISFCFWLKTSQSGVRKSYFGRYTGGTGGWGVEIDTDNKLHFRTWNTSGVQESDAPSASTINDGKWHFFVCEKATVSLTGKIYMDTDSGGTTTTLVNRKPAGNLLIGGGNINGYSDFAFDDFAILSRLTTAQERADISYSSGRFFQVI